MAQGRSLEPSILGSSMNPEPSCCFQGTDTEAGLLVQMNALCSQSGSVRHGSFPIKPLAHPGSVEAADYGKCWRVEERQEGLHPHSWRPLPAPHYLEPVEVLVAGGKMPGVALVSPCPAGW